MTPTDRELRIGVIGVQPLGQQHVQIIGETPGARVVAVADNVAGPLRGNNLTMAEYADSIGATAYTDGIAMIEREELDAVSLCVSPKWRQPLVVAVAARGVPTLIEKPWAANMEQGRELAAVVRRANLTVMTELSLRFQPPVIALRDLLHTGPLGKPYVVNADLCMTRIASPSHWVWDPQNGNSPINENTCHIFDTLCYLLGDPVSLHAYGGNFHGVGAPLPDGAAITVEFANGTVAALTGGALGARGIGIRTWLDVYAEGGQAILTGSKHRYDTLTWAQHGQDNAETETWETPPQLMHAALGHFIDSVRTGTPPSCTVDDGMRALALSMAVQQSLREKSPVPVEWR